jgi:hypothetical protein
MASEGSFFEINTTDLLDTKSGSREEIPAI